MRYLLIIGSFVALSACAGTPAPNYVPVSKAISFPALGKETIASLGEDMVKQGIYTESDGIELTGQNNIKGYKLSPGFYPQISEDKEFTYHSYENRSSRDGAGYLISSNDFIGFPLPIPQSVRASKTKQETCVVIGGLSGTSCDTQHSFTRKRQPSLSNRDLQQTLIYSGRIGNRIRIGYRETSGSFARPAFSNEAEYDLSTSGEIAYRGAKISVIEADNQKIRYIVLSNFNSQ